MLDRWLQNRIHPSKEGLTIFFQDMTDRKRVELALKESEMRYRSLVIATSQVVWRNDGAGQMVEDCPSWRRLTGQSEDESKGLGWMAAIHPEDRERTAQQCDRALATKSLYQDECRVRTADGTYRFFSVRGVPILDENGEVREWVGTYTDITARQQAEAALQKSRDELEMRVEERTKELTTANAALQAEITERQQTETARRESEERFRSAFEYAAIGMALVAPDGRFLKVNHSLVEIVGYSESELLSRTVQDITHPDDLATDINYVQQLLASKINYYQMEKRYYHKRGEVVWVFLNVSLLRDDQSQPSYLISQIQDITSRKQVEAALYQSEQRYRSLANATAQVIWITDAEGNTTSSTLNWQKLTGQTNAEIRELGWLDAVHPDDRDRVRQSWAEAVAAKHLYKTDQRVRMKDGSYHYFAVRGVPIVEPDGSVREWIGTCTDFTERKQAEIALRESEQRLRAILDNYPAIIYHKDMQGRFVFVNCQFEIICQITRERVIGKTDYGVFPAEFAECYMANDKLTLEAGRPMEFEEPIPDIHGVQTYLSIKFPLFDTDGVPYAVCGISLNINDRKYAEKVLQQAKEELEIKVRERTAELQNLNEELKRSNQELDQFAYITSHDLQEPLRAIAGYTQLLEREYQERLDPTAQEYISYVVDGATRMQHLIRDLLAYSRAGTCTQVFTATNCNQVLHRAVANLEVAIAESIATITHDPLPTLTVDKNQLLQLFQNLIGNAIKFCRDKPPQVHIAAELIEQAWRFQVRDNGIGIKPQHLDRIFVIFKRLHTRKEFPGTGIGLAICKKIVERHDGCIWAESQLGVGTTFYFTLPLTPQIKPDSDD